MTRSRIVMLLALCIVLALAVALRYAVYNVLPYTAIRPYRIVAQDVESRYGSANPLRAQGIEVQDFSFRSADSLRLSAWYVPANNASATILVLHGIASSKEMAWKTIQMYHEMGLNVVAYDSRAHGQSEGLNATMGYYEKHDVSACLQYLQEHFPTNGPLLLHGFSMGGAIGLQALEIEPRIHAAIVEGAFCNLRETMHDYAADIFRIRLPWINDVVIRESERIAAFSVDSVRPEAALRSVHVPLLFIHGLNDEKISYHYAERNHTSAASAEKELLLVPGATHMKMPDDERLRVNQRIKSFIQKVVSEYNSKKP